jgi:1-acyl-sn-glycerol-3-phosphate acyltransferase
MSKATNIIEKTAWFAYSAFWGLAVGLLLLLFTLSPVALGEAVPIASLLPLVLVALLFPVIGAICDRLHSHHLFTSGLTLSITLLFILDVATGFRLQSQLLLILGLPALVLGFFTPLTTFAGIPFRKTLQKNALYFITWSGSLLTLMLVQRVFVDIDSFVNFYYTLFIGTGFLATILFFMQSEYTWGQQRDRLSTILKEELKKFLAQDVAIHNFRLLLLATILFIAGAWNATRFSLELWSAITLQTNLVMLPLILLTVILVSAYTPKMIRAFGPKRHFTAMTVLALVLYGLQSWASTSVEHYILLLLHVSILTSNLLNIFSLSNWLLPQNHMGQGFAWIAWSVVLGYAFGEAIFDLPPFLNVLLFSVLMVAGSIVIQFFCKAGSIEQGSQDVRHRGGPLLTWPTDALQPHANAQHNRLTSMLQSLARITAEIFFARIRIVGAQHLQVPGGAILVANHPNTFLDPMLITALSPGRLHYWAKSTLWSLPFLGSILDRLGAIPVYRQQDQNHQSKGKANLKSLELAAEKLRAGGWVLIFPEGVSEQGLSLKPLKTGAARLGFLANQEDLPIIPIGIDYMEPGVFRSNITLRIGQPIRLNDYHDLHQEDERKAVRKATQDLSNRMKHLLPHLDENHLESLVMRIYHLYGERVLEILECKDETEARRTIAQAVNHYQSMDADTVRLFSQRLDTYWHEYERLGTPENHDPIKFHELLKIFVQMHSFAGFGLLTNWVPYKLTGRCVELLTPKPVWLGTAKILVGGVLFGLYYTLVGTLMGILTTPLLGVLLTLLIGLAGILSLGAMDRFAFRMHQFHTLWQAFWTQDTDENLDEMRISLIQDLERFRESYAFFADPTEPENTPDPSPQESPQDSEKIDAKETSQSVEEA